MRPGWGWGCSPGDPSPIQGPKMGTHLEPGGTQTPVCCSRVEGNKGHAGGCRATLGREACVAQQQAPGKALEHRRASFCTSVKCEQ